MFGFKSARGLPWSDAGIKSTRGPAEPDAEPDARCCLGGGDRLRGGEGD